MAEFTLDKKTVFIDDVDLPLAFGYRWRAGKSGYVEAYGGGGRERNTTVRMHRLIMQSELKEGLTVDHINGNGFDNRRSNLRVCTQGQNNQNMHTKGTSKSGIPGVYWSNSSRKWSVWVRSNGKSIFCGNFGVEEFDEAVKLAAKLRAEHMPFATVGVA